MIRAVTKKLWHEELSSIRSALGLSQADLAERTHISVASIKAYEAGRRHPSRPYLTAILDAMQVDRSVRNRVLSATGYAPDGLEVRPPNITEWWFTADEAQCEIDGYAWPSFVLTERGEVAAANAVAQRLWDVDLSREYLDAIERNLLCVASDPKFADRLVNWDEAMGRIASVFSSFHRHPETLEKPSPYFQAVLQRFLKGDPKYVGRFLEIWRSAPPYGGKTRWTYPVVWEEPGVGRMRFTAVVSPANESDGLAFNDWMPADAESWEGLGRLMEARVTVR